MNSCLSCGFDNQVAARFCGGCGVPLQTSNDKETEAERRVICVIFSDIVGATALAEMLDIEEYRSLLYLYHGICTRVVNEFDGFLADLMGDGIVAYFGFPSAHEDDEIRAVRSALAIQEAILELNSEVRHPFQIRIGIHRGRVVVGALGALSGVNSLAIGETPNIASRLQSEAQPGEVVVSDSLWRLVAHRFNGESLGSRRIKGIQRSIEIYRIINYRPRTRSNGLGTPFIGRQRELESIQSIWRKTLAGHTNCIMLRGEPGIGKSRLIQHLYTDLDESDVLVMGAFCNPFTSDSPFFPLAEMLRSRLRLNQLDPEKQLEELASRLALLGLPEQEAVPLIAKFLSLEIDDKAWPILDDLSLVRQRQRTLEFLAQTLISLASEAPVLLVIEDLQWADASSIELLSYFLDALNRHRILLLFTARLEFQSPWGGKSNFVEILLDSLVSFEAQQIIRDVASNKAMPPELIRQISVRSAGNPLFLEEITLAVLSSGCVIEGEQIWELVRPFSVDIVPASMEVALMARLDRIGSAKALLQIGATIGREFSLDLLAAVACVDMIDAEKVMHKLVDEGFLRKAVHDQRVFIFKHALVQDTAYESLLRSTRVKHHARIAVVMEENFPDLTRQRPELMAHHLSGAKRFAEAAHLWLVAGRLAAERSAVNEAVEHLNRGLTDLEQFPPNNTRWALELSLNSVLAPVQMAALGWASPMVERSCMRAIDLAEQLGEVDRRFPLLWGLWSNQFVAGNLGDAITSAYKLLHLGKSADSPLYFIPSRNAASYTHFYRGEYARAIHHADIGRTYFDQTLELQLCQVFQSAPSVHILSAKGNSLWMLGQQAAARRQMDHMLERARGLNHSPSIAAGLGYLCYFYYYERNWLRILDAASEAFEISSAEGYTLWRTCADLYKACALIELGKGSITPQDLLERAQIFRQTLAFITDPSTSTIIMDGLCRMGRYEEALAESSIGLSTAERGQISVMVPEILRFRGDVLVQLGQLQGADQSYQDAVHSAKQQGAVSLELRALTSLLQFRYQQNLSLEESTRLQELLDLLKNEPLTDDIQSARVLLKQFY